MRRIIVFVIILLSGIASYAAVAVVSATLLAQPQRSYGDMMGMGGMGGWWTAQASVQSPYSPLVWLLSITAVTMAVVGAAGLIYTVFKPEPDTRKVETLPVELPKNIQSTSKTAEVLTVLSNKEPMLPTKEVEEPVPPTQSDSVETALKVLKPDELQVIEILKINDNHYLQKWISKDSGMSRLQTHRVVARLIERNLVTITKNGNTNEVSLAPWLINGESHSA